MEVVLSSSLPEDPQLKSGKDRKKLYWLHKGSNGRDRAEPLPNLQRLAFGMKMAASRSIGDMSVLLLTATKELKERKLLKAG